MTLENKIDFAVVFSVKNANPNGDPLNGNRPRITYDNLGEVSDVCIKRKIRNRLMEKGYSIFVQSDDNRVDEHKNLRKRAASVLSKIKEKEDQIKEATKTWFDVRAFGQVFAFSDKKGKEKDGLDKVSIGIRGPVSIHPAFSIEPIEIISSQITKSVSGEGDKKGSDTMGMKHRIEFGIYRFNGSINPQLASRTGFSNDDAAVFKKILPGLFENDASSARPEGSMEVLKVVWWEHNCPNGQMSSAKVHKSLDVNSDGAIDLEKIERLEAEIIDGF